MRESVLLAHAGGVPEALTIGLPVLIFVGFVLMEKRARKREGGTRTDEEEDPT